VFVLDESNAENVSLLQKHSDVGWMMQEYQSLLRMNANALVKQILNPGDLPSCTPHAKMRMKEKITKIFNLVNMRRVIPPAKFTEFYKKLEDAVNTKVLKQANAGSDSG